MYPDVFWCILRKYCILAYPDVFWNVFSYFVVCDRDTDTLCFMYCDVSWCILSVSDAEDEIHGGLIGAPPHPSLPPDLHTDSGYVYTSCSRTYPARLKHVSRISATYLNGCAKIHTWALYLACLACILHVSTIIWHAVRRYVLWACIPHVSCMYPACIWHAKPGYIKIH